GSIADNIRFGKENATMDEIITAAKNAQIHDSILQFPNGYESIVGQKGVNLSGGQKQRISIARALVRYPKILMFDDSTSALDLDSIADNIRFGKENATMDEIITAAKNAQIHDSILQFPNGYESIVGQKGVNLSGGQKQRISIARALVRYPKILMFDDSTSALD